MTENTELTQTPHETAILDLIRQLTESTAENYESIGRIREYIDGLGDPKQDIDALRQDIADVKDGIKTTQQLQASVDDMTKTLNATLASDEKNTNRVIELADSVSRSSKEIRGQAETNKTQIDQIWKTLNDEGRGVSGNVQRLSKNIAVITKRLDRLEEQAKKDSNSAKNLLQEMGRYMKLSARIDLIERSLPKLVRKNELEAFSARMGADRIQNQLPAPDA